MAYGIDIAIRLLAYDLASGSMIGFASDILRLGQNASLAKGAMSDLATAAGVLSGATIVAAGAFALFAFPTKVGVESAIELQQALVRLQIATNSTADAMPVLTNAVNDLAIKTVYGSTEAAGAFERLSEMGFNVSQILYGVGASADEYKQHAYDATEATNGLGAQALYLGQAMKTDATTGALLLGAALHTFQDQGLSAADTANLLAGAYFNGVPSADALTEAINMAGAQADTAGIKFQDFLATLTMLTQSGLSASSAGASLNYMIQAMIAPTQKQEAALASLHIMTVNTGSAFKDFTAKLRDSGPAGDAAVKAFDGSVTSLHNLFYAAQNAGLVGLDENFNNWAMKAGVLKNSLFDASGQFIGMKGAIQTLDNAMSGMNTEQKMNMLGELFNIRSGRAARILTNINDFTSAYDAAFKRVGATNVLDAAMKQLETFGGEFDAFKDSVSSALAVAIMPFLNIGSKVLAFLNDLVQKFINLDPNIQKFVGGFLLGGTVLTGIATIVLGVATAITALVAVAGAALAPVLAGIAVGFAVLISLGEFLVAAFFAVKYAIEQAAQPGTLFNTILVPAVQFLQTVWTHFQQFLKDEAIPTFKTLEPILKIIGIAMAVMAGIVVGVVIVAILAVVGAMMLIVIIVTEVIQFIGFLLGKLGELKDWIGDQLPKIGQFFANVWNGIVTFVTGAWTAIHNRIAAGIAAVQLIIQSGMNFVSDIFHNAIATVVGWFVWLYNHNYYFKDLVDFITNAISGIKTWLGDTWNSIVNSIVERWNYVKNMANAIWSALVVAIESHINQGKSQVTGTVNSLATTLTGIWNTIKAIAINLWSQIVTGIQQQVDKVKQFVQTAMDAAKAVITNMFGPMFDAGKHLAQMVADGIRAGIGAIRDAVGAAAGAIGNFLGFHSPTKEGPGATADQWMPAMMAMLAHGITSNTHLLTTATNSAMLGVQGGFASPIRNPFGLVAGQAGVNGNITVQVPIDGKVVTEVVLDRMTGAVVRAGSNRLARN